MLRIFAEENRSLDLYDMVFYMYWLYFVKPGMNCMSLCNVRFSWWWLWKMSSGMLHSVALVRTGISKECIASIIRVTRINVLGIMLAITSNWSKLCWFLSPWWWKQYVPLKCRLLQYTLYILYKWWNIILGHVNLACLHKKYNHKLYQNGVLCSNIYIFWGYTWLSMYN
jgi:hypothetical protein